MPGSTISTDHYTIGGGELYFAATIADEKMLSGSAPTFCDNAHSLGNITDVSITPDVTYIDHYVSSKGKRVKDKTVANTVSLNIGFTFDEMNYANINKFMLGDLSGSTVKVLQNTLEEGSAVLRVNTDIGKSMVYRIPKCTLKPEGDLSLNEEDWQTGAFNLEVLEYVDGDSSNATINASWIAAPFGILDPTVSLG